MLGSTAGTAILGLTLYLACRAQGAGADSCTSGYEWMGDVCNLLDQIDSACSGQDATPLPLPSIQNSTSYSAANSTCQCNRVYFNMHVACKYCQGNTDDAQLKWSQWTKPCPFNQTSHTPSSGTSGLPAWVLINTTPEDTFNLKMAREAAGNKSLNWGRLQIVVVSIVSGIAAIALAISAILYVRRRKAYHTHSQTPPSSGSSNTAFKRFSKALKRLVTVLPQPKRFDTKYGSHVDLAEGDEDQLGLLQQSFARPRTVGDTTTFTPPVYESSRSNPHLTSGLNSDARPQGGNSTQERYSRYPNVNTNQRRDLRVQTDYTGNITEPQQGRPGEASTDARMSPITPLPSTPPGWGR